MLKVVNILLAVVSLEMSDSSDSDEGKEETDTEKKEGEVEEEKPKKGKKKKRKESEEQPPVDYSHQVELSVLDAVENLEERVASASLQVKVNVYPSGIQLVQNKILSCTSNL